MNSYRAITWMIIWASTFSITMSCLKLLENVSVYTALAARLGFSLLLLLPAMISSGKLMRLPQRLPLYIFNGLTRGGALLCVYYAYSKLPMAIAASIGYTDSLITVIMAMAILKEKIQGYQWFAIAVGYLGVIVMYQPHSTSFNVALGIALLSNIFASLAKISTKKLIATEDNISILFYCQIFAFLACLVLSINIWQTPSAHDIYCLIILSLTGTLSGYAYIQALRYGDVAFIAPLDYLKLLFAIPISFLIFNEIPTMHAIFGAGLILVASIALIIFNARKSRS